MAASIRLDSQELYSKLSGSTTDSLINVIIFFARSGTDAFELVVVLDAAQCFRCDCLNNCAAPHYTACMNCRFMPLAIRRARMAAVEGDAALPASGGAVPRAQKGRGRRRSTASHGPPGKVRKVDTLARKVDTYI